MLRNILIVLATAALAAYRVRTLRRSKVSAAKALGLRLDRYSLLDIVAGAAIAALAFSAVFFSERALGWHTITRVGPASALVRDLATAIVVPLQEEFVFRCAILGALCLVLRNLPVAVTVSALLFALGHAANQNAGVVSFISSFLGGLIYGFAFAATQRIWLPFGLHMGWNYAQGRLFGFHLSGGAVHPAPFIGQTDTGPALFTGGAYGPEGGLIGILARLIVLALLALWLRASRPRISGRSTSDLAPPPEAS